MKYLLLTLLFCGIAAGQEKVKQGSGVIVWSDATNLYPTEKLAVENLTPDEQKQIDAARKQLRDVEAKIRRGHGEFVRNVEGVATTADCWLSNTIVEIHETQVLIRTKYAGSVEHPGCF